MQTEIRCQLGMVWVRPYKGRKPVRVEAAIGMFPVPLDGRTKRAQQEIEDGARRVWFTTKGQLEAGLEEATVFAGGRTPEEK